MMFIYERYLKLPLSMRPHKQLCQKIVEVFHSNSIQKRETRNTRENGIEKWIEKH